MGEMNELQYIAHVRQMSGGQWDIHDLADHCRGVAELAGKFASGFNSSDWAKVAGLWHDLGKYRSAFQGYIRKESGYEPEALLSRSVELVSITSSVIVRGARL